MSTMARPRQASGRRSLGTWSFDSRISNGNRGGAGNRIDSGPAHDGRRDSAATGAVTSPVRMRVLMRAEIHEYSTTGQWEGTAGGHRTLDQDAFVPKMSGGQSNLVGLPMGLVEKMLGEINIVPVQRS